MIERLQRIASILARFEGLLLLLCALCIGLFAYSLMQSSEGANDALMMPAMIGFCWAALLICVSRLFRRVPEVPGRQHGFLRRLVLRFQRAVAAVLAVLIIALSLAVLVFSYQFLRLFLTS